MATSRYYNLSVAQVITALKKLTEAVEQTVEDGRQKYEPLTVNEYVSLANKDGIRRMYKPMPSYAECMLGLGVATRAGLEELWKGLYRDSEVQECVEELLSAEESYEEFIAEVDEELQREEGKCVVPSAVTTVGQQLPRDLSFVEAKSGESTSLQSQRKQSKFTLLVLMRHFG